MPTLVLDTENNATDFQLSNSLPRATSFNNPKMSRR